MLSCNWKRRNFSGYKDGIAVLTHTAWAAISTSVSKVSYDLQLRRGIDSPRFCNLLTVPSDCGVGQNILQHLFMIDSKRIKEILISMGADLCGIASIDRFKDSPKGFHPTNVMPTCKSVISFACRFPIGTLSCRSAIPYTRVRNSMTPKLDAIALDFCIEMERNGIVCVPIQQMKASGMLLPIDSVRLYRRSTLPRLLD